LPIATEYIGITAGSSENVGTKFVVGVSNLIVSFTLLMARNCKRKEHEAKRNH